MEGSTKKTKNNEGFTLVEITVVLAIVSILSLVGIAVLVNLRNGPILDSAAQGMVTALREAQNKALSVASTPDASVPVAWGVYVDGNTDMIQPFYIDQSKAFQAEGLAATHVSGVDIIQSGYYVYSAPFGKFYSSLTEPSPSSWTFRLVRPYDAIGNISGGPTNVELVYKNNSRTVTIDSAGEVNAR